MKRVESFDPGVETPRSGEEDAGGVDRDPVESGIAKLDGPRGDDRRVGVEVAISGASLTRRWLELCLEAEAARVSDEGIEQELSPDQLEELRALGYV